MSTYRKQGFVWVDEGVAIGHSISTAMDGCESSDVLESLRRKVDMAERIFAVIAEAMPEGVQDRIAEAIGWERCPTGATHDH